MLLQAPERSSHIGAKTTSRLGDKMPFTLIFELSLGSILWSRIMSSTTDATWSQLHAFKLTIHEEEKILHNTYRQF